MFWVGGGKNVRNKEEGRVMSTAVVAVLGGGGDEDDKSRGMRGNKLTNTTLRGR